MIPISIMKDEESVKIIKRGHPFAQLIPEPKKTPAKLNASKHMKRLDTIWGNRIFSEQEVKSMRRGELEGEAG